MNPAGGLPPLRALLIGIDHYPPPRDPRIPRYGHLYGCVRDVERIARWLQRGLGVPGERIARLTAPHGAAPPPDRRHEWPSYEGLVAAFERLIEEARPGEHVWVHYSGHGGRAPTLVPERKGPLGLDECLVPWDVGDPGARYLRDVELAVLLARMEAAGLFVTAVIDCCHAGGAVRAGTRARGTDAIDRTPRPTESLVAPRARLTEAQRRPAVAWRHAELPESRAFDPTGYVLLAACRPGERTVEEPCDDREPGGAFTRSLLRALDGMDRGATYAQLLVAAGEDVRSRHPGQTPMIEGEAGRPLLGGRELPRPRGVVVLGEGRAAGTIRLATGQVHGVARGDRFAVEPPAVGLRTGSGQPRSAGPVTVTGASRTVVEVTDVGAAVTEARPVGRASDSVPLAGDRAVLVPELSGYRAHQERWRRLARLENYESGAFLRGRLEATLERLPAGWQPGAPVRGEPFDPAGVPEIEAGRWVVLRIANRAPEELNVAVLDLRPDWSVAQAFPRWRGGWYQPVDADGELVIPLRAWLPEGMASGTDVLVVLATTGPVSHRWLELPPLTDTGDEEVSETSMHMPRLAASAETLPAETSGDEALTAPPEEANGDPGDRQAGPVRAGTEPLDDGPDGWSAARVTLKVLSATPRP